MCPFLLEYPWHQNDLLPDLHMNLWNLLACHYHFDGGQPPLAESLGLPRLVCTSALWLEPGLLLRSQGHQYKEVPLAHAWLASEADTLSWWRAKDLR